MVTNQKGWVILEELIGLLESEHVFERRRKSDMAKALAVYSYLFDLSLRRASELVSHFEPASHEAVRKWYRRLGRHVQAFDKAVRDRVVSGNVRVTSFVEKTGSKIGSKWMSEKLPLKTGEMAVRLQVGGNYPIRGSEFTRDFAREVSSEIIGTAYEEGAWYSVDKVWI